MYEVNLKNNLHLITSSQAQALQDYDRHVQQLQQALQFLSREIQHAK
jgi:hypothetical protein